MDDIKVTRQINFIFAPLAYKDLALLLPPHADEGESLSKSLILLHLLSFGRNEQTFALCSISAPMKKQCKFTLLPPSLPRLSMSFFV
jgi:hypothetical protein